MNFGADESWKTPGSEILIESGRENAAIVGIVGTVGTVVAGEAEEVAVGESMIAAHPDIRDLLRGEGGVLTISVARHPLSTHTSLVAVEGGTTGGATGPHLLDEAHPLADLSHAHHLRDAVGWSRAVVLHRETDQCPLPRRAAVGDHTADQGLRHVVTVVIGQLLLRLRDRAHVHLEDETLEETAQSHRPLEASPHRAADGHVTRGAAEHRHL